ncbi:MAG TPA: hypothetical protein VK056_02355 [Bacillota bacterium]|nr:hypothetical protein [Bacillota bacterium]
MQRAIKEPFHHLPQKIKIIGQKHQNRYTIRRKLTNNPLMATYLCQFKGKDVVLKIGEPTKTFTKEINYLQTINEAQKDHLGPSLLDIDYWQADDGEVFLFYVTKYTKGVNLQTFFKRHKRNWLPLFICQLLDQLLIIHNKGFVLGQLTPNHLLVTKSTEIRFTHLNGIVQRGDYIQQEPNFYDKNFWALSSRKIQPSNNLFSVVMVVLQIYYPEQFVRTKHPRKQLIKKIDGLPLSIYYKQCFLKAIFGKYETADQMKSDFIKAIYMTEDIRYLPDKRRKTSISETTVILLFALSYFISANIFL